MMKKFLNKKIISLLLAASIAGSVFNGLTLNVSAYDGTGDDNSTSNSEDLELGLGAEIPFADLHETDIQSISRALKFSMDQSSDDNESIKGKYPESVDLSDSDYFPQIRTQGTVGSCVCWAVVYYGFTYEYCRANNLSAKDVNNEMSPLFVYDQIKMNDSEGGSWSETALDYLYYEGAPRKVLADGETSWNEHDAKTWFPKKEVYKDAPLHKISDSKFLTHPDQITSPYDSDLDEMKKYLNEGHIINFAAQYRKYMYGTLPEESSHAGEKCIYNSRSNGSSQGHEMTIVGYDDNICYDINGNGTIEEAERGAFKIANSHGDAWANHGFGWVMYDSLNNYSSCIENTEYRPSTMYSLSVMFVEKSQYDPKFFAVINMNTADRSENDVAVLAKHKASGKKLRWKFAPFDYNNYYSVSLDGSSEARDGELAMDLDWIFDINSLDEFNEYDWSVEVEDSYGNDNTTKINDFYIEYNDVKLLELEESGVSLNKEKRELALKKSGSICVDKDDIFEGDEINITSKLASNDENVSYKFVDIFDGKENLIRDYDTDNSAKYVISNAGEHTIKVYVKDGDSYCFDFEKKITVTKKPYVKKLDYDKDMCIRNFTINFEAEFDGGFGEVCFDDIYVIGGNYPEGKKTLHLTTNKNKASWTPDMDGEYEMFATVKDSKGNTNEVTLGNIIIDKEKPLELKSFTCESYDTHHINNYVTLNASGKYGSGKYKYRYGVIFNGVEYIYKDSYRSDKDGFADSERVHFNPTDLIFKNTDETTLNIGNNTFFVDVKDEVTGDVVRATEEHELKGLEVVDIQYNDNEHFVGESIYLNASVKGAYYTETEGGFYYSLDGGVTYQEVEDSSWYRYSISTCYFTPKEAENYKIKFFVKDTFGQTAEKIIDLSVRSKEETVIYYDGPINNPNIHYKKDDGEWTAVPGVKMQASDTVSHKWMIKIDMQDAECVTFCFNDGKGNWDSNNGQNYHIAKGKYAVSNGRVQAISTNKAVIYYNNSWQKANIHYSIGNGEWTTAPGVAMKNSDKPGYRWMYILDIPDNQTADICFNDGNNWDSCNGQNYHITAGEYEVVNGNLKRIY